jgi:microcystin-dependent protein
MESFIGTIAIYGFNYAPQEWMMCQGQQLAVSQYSALYSLIGIAFGGDGRVSFNLPDLQARMPVGFGHSVSVGESYNLGQAGGTSRVVLNSNNLPPVPPHTHQASASVPAPSVSVKVSTNTAGNQTTPSAQNSYLSASGGGTGSATIWSSVLENVVDLGGVEVTSSPSSVSVQPAVAFAGASYPIVTQSPFLALNFCIAVTGLYPPRS